MFNLLKFYSLLEFSLFLVLSVNDPAGKALFWETFYTKMQYLIFFCISWILGIVEIAVSFSSDVDDNFFFEDAPDLTLFSGMRVL